MPRFAPQTRLTSTKGKADKLVVEPGASAHGGDCVGQRHTSTGGEWRPSTRLTQVGGKGIE